LASLLTWAASDMGFKTVSQHPCYIKVLLYFKTKQNLPPWLYRMISSQELQFWICLSK